MTIQSFRARNVFSSHLRLTLCAGVLAAGWLAAMPSASFAQAKDTAPVTAAASASAGAQNSATARREAAAAAAEAKRGNLSDKGQDYQTNARQRCARLPADLKADCESRAKGEGSVSGSVQGGGVLRQTITTTTVPADPSTPETTTAPVVRDLQPLPAAPAVPQ